MVAANRPADPVAVAMPVDRPADAAGVMMAARVMMMSARVVMVMTACVRMTLGFGRRRRQAVHAHGEDHGKGKFQYPHGFTPAPFKSAPVSVGALDARPHVNGLILIAEALGKAAQEQVVSGLLHWPARDSQPTCPAARTLAQSPVQPISVTWPPSGINLAITRLRLVGPAWSRGSSFATSSPSSELWT